MANQRYVRYTPNHLQKKEKNTTLKVCVTAALAVCIIAICITSFVFASNRAQALESLDMNDKSIGERQTETYTMSNLSYSIPTELPPVIATVGVQETAKEISVQTTRLAAKVVTYDPTVDYTKLMLECLDEAQNSENPEYALAVAEIYEEQRNLKIRQEGLIGYEETHNFSKSRGLSLAELKTIYYGKQTYIPYTEEELIAVARIVYAEAGSSFITDEHQRAVASVLVNRVTDGRFGGHTIMGVIRQPNQYSTYRNTTYDARSLANAQYVLDNGPINNGLYQANFKQGHETIITYSYPQCRTTYICR